jgi:hypothetical protein
VKCQIYLGTSSIQPIRENIIKDEKCQFMNIAVMPVTFNLNCVRNSQTYLQTDAQNVAGQSVRWFQLPHSVSKVVDGTVMAMAQKLSQINQKAILQ